jgi:hypothetical protein
MEVDSTLNLVEPEEVGIQIRLVSQTRGNKAYLCLVE